MELHAVLVMLMHNGWDYVLDHGKITRIDIAVDLPGVRMDEFMFLPQQGLTMAQWAVDGHLETLCFGKPGGNQTVIYNKKKEQLALGKPWLGKSVVRVERRLRSPAAKKLADLKQWSNPFAKMVLTEIMPPPPDNGKDRQWSMFEDSINVRGLTNALALLLEDRRKKYRAHLKQHPQKWWDPEAIWSHWPEAYTALLHHFA